MVSVIVFVVVVVSVAVVVAFVVTMSMLDVNGGFPKRMLEATSNSHRFVYFVATPVIPRPMLLLIAIVAAMVMVRQTRCFARNSKPVPFATFPSSSYFLLFFHKTKNNFR